MELKANKFGVLVHMLNGKSEIIECESREEAREFIEQIKTSICTDNKFVITYGTETQTVINPLYIIEAREVWYEEDTVTRMKGWYTKRNGKNIRIKVCEK